MVGILLFLGCFMEQLAIMMLTLPCMMPVIKTLGLTRCGLAAGADHDGGRGVDAALRARTVRDEGRRAATVTMFESTERPRRTSFSTSSCSG